MSPTFRRARNSDAVGLNRVNRAAWEQAYRGHFPDSVFDEWDDAARVERWRARAEIGNPLWVADIDGDIVGYGGYRIEEEIANVVLLYVHPDHQRQGIAAGIMRAMVLDSEAREVHIFALERNDHARSVYRDSWRGEPLPDGTYEMDGTTYTTHGFRWSDPTWLVRRLSPVTIREWTDTDDVVALTDLLHRGYRRMADSNIHFVATHQPPETTRQRIGEGRCYLVEIDAAIVGTAVLTCPAHNPYCGYEGIGTMASFSQFTVEPAWQGAGVGTRLLRHIEACARTLGAQEIGLNTAQPATELVAYYERMGYEIKCEADWRPEVNYKSWVMVKTL